MDFAHSTNGYFYHTKYDAFDTIPLETLQHTGDNILSITKALADSSELENIEVIHLISNRHFVTDNPEVSVYIMFLIISVPVWNDWLHTRFTIPFTIHICKLIQSHADGKAIFFDFLNWFMIYYSETTGIIINILISVAAIGLIFVSIYFMAKKSGEHFNFISFRLGII